MWEKRWRKRKNNENDWKMIREIGKNREKYRKIRKNRGKTDINLIWTIKMIWVRIAGPDHLNLLLWGPD